MAGVKAIVVGGPPMDDEEESKDEMDSEAGYHDELKPVAESLLKAFEAKDVDAIADALADAHAVCSGYLEGGKKSEME